MAKIMHMYVKQIKFVCELVSKIVMYTVTLGAYHLSEWISKINKPTKGDRANHLLFDFQLLFSVDERLGNWKI